MTTPAHLDVSMHLQQSVTGYTHDGNELTLDFITKINEIIDALTSGGAIGDITEIVAGVNLDGGGDTGVVTIDVSPTVDLAGASDVSTLIARKDGAARTASFQAAVYGLDSATYDTGSSGSALYTVGVYGENTGSRSAGSDDLQQWGVFGNPRGTCQVAIGVVGWAQNAAVSAAAVNYGGFFQSDHNAIGTNIGVVGYAGAGGLTPFVLSGGDIGSVFSGIFRGGTLKCESDFKHTGTNLGVFSTTPTTKPTATGSRSANAALASFLTGMAGLGLLTDSTSAGSAPYNGVPIVEHLSGVGGVDPNVVISPLDDVAFLKNTGASETVQTFTLAVSTVDGHTIEIVNASGASATKVCKVVLAASGESGVNLSSTSGYASFTVVWNNTDAYWQVVGTPRAFTIS